MKIGDLKSYKIVSRGASPAQETAAEQDNRDLLEKGADFAEKYVPGAQIGKAIGNSIHGIIESALSGSIQPLMDAGNENNENYGRIVGDTVSAVAAPASLVVGGGVAAQAAKFAGLGAAASGGSSLAHGADAKTALKDAASGAALSAVIPVAGKALTLSAKALTQALPKRLMQSAIGQTKTEILAGKDVSEHALKNLKIGTPAKLIKEAKAAIDILDQQIQHNLDVIAPKTARLLNAEVVSNVVKEVNAGGGAITPKEVSTIVHNLAPQAKALLTKSSLSLTEANKLRVALDKTIGDKGFLTSQLPFNKDVMRAFSNTLREKVKTLAPKGTRQLFDEMSKEITLRNAVQKKYAGQASNQVLNAFDMMLAGGGFLGGGPVGAAATVAAKKVAQSATGKTVSAVALNQLSRLGPVAAKLAPAEKALLVEVIANLLGQPEESQLSENTNQ